MVKTMIKVKKILLILIAGTMLLGCESSKTDNMPISYIVDFKQFIKSDGEIYINTHGIYEDNLIVSINTPNEGIMSYKTLDFGLLNLETKEYSSLRSFEEVTRVWDVNVFNNQVYYSTVWFDEISEHYLYYIKQAAIDDKKANDEILFTEYTNWIFNTPSFYNLSGAMYFIKIGTQLEQNVPIGINSSVYKINQDGQMALIHREIAEIEKELQLSENSRIIPSPELRRGINNLSFISKQGQNYTVHVIEKDSAEILNYPFDIPLGDALVLDHHILIETVNNEGIIIAAYANKNNLQNLFSLDIFPGRAVAKGNVIAYIDDTFFPQIMIEDENGFDSTPIPLPKGKAPRTTFVYFTNDERILIVDFLESGELEIIFNNLDI